MVPLQEVGMFTEPFLQETDFRGFLAVSTDWFWKTGPDLRVSYISPSFQEQTGMPAEQPVGRSILELLGSVADSDAGRSLQDDFMHHRRFKNFIRSFSDADGRQRHVRLNGVPEFGVDGDFLGYRGSGCDVTAEIEALERAERAQATAEQSEHKLRAILENSADAIVTIDEHGVIDVCNPATLHMFGYREDELCGHNVSMLMPEPDRNRHDGYIRRYVETGEARIINIGRRDVTGLRKDGSMFPLALAIGEMALDGRRFFVGTMRDITLRVRIEQKLAESQQELAAAQQIAQLGSWSVNLRTQEAHWSEEMRRLMGIYSAENHASPDLGFKATHPDDRAIVLGYVDALMTGPDRVATFDYRMVPLDDAPERVVHAEMRVLTDSDGAPKRIVGTAQDVTEARHMAAQLARGKENLVEAQRIARMGSWELSPLTSEVQWSTALYELFGFDPAEQQPSSELALTLVHPEDREEQRQGLTALVNGATQHDASDLRMIREDGSVRFMHAEAAAEKDARGRVVRIIGTTQDVTAQRASENSLREALAAANEANRMKSTFLANMSHELRTPLNAIIGFSDLVLMKLKDIEGIDKIREYIKDINDSGVHLVSIINDILDMSRSETDFFIISEELFELPEAIDWVVRMNQEAARTQTIDFLVEVESPLPRVLGEARLIRQALLNLVSNAIKFTPSGGQISIQAHRTDQGCIEIVISDSGIGMRPEDIPIALKPFGQVDSSLNRKYGGSGLGLPLAKRFIELHDGTLTVESVSLQGTTITIAIPQSRCP
jgi:PAS domain S-box-containing protein